MTVRAAWSQLVRAWRQAPYTFTALVGAIALSVLVGIAIWDSVTSARASSHRVYESTLSAELSNFLLAVRASDGSTLLDNPADFSAARRPIYPVTLRRSYFTYLLNRANAKSFDVDKLLIDLPRSCTLEFRGRASVVQVCMAVVPRDTAGRYIYFAIKYHAPGVHRHQPGEPLEDADRVVLRPNAERLNPITLVFSAPSLAVSRYPSQMRRFDNVHEVSAYHTDPNRPVRQVHAQAIERGESGESANTVTIIGRIDSGLLTTAEGVATDWPTAEIRTMRFGLSIYGQGGSVLAEIQADEPGEAVESLQKAYVTNVVSNATILVSSLHGASRAVWTSDQLQLSTPVRRGGWAQKVSDWWAPKLMDLLGAPLDTAPVHSLQPYRSGGVDLAAEIRATPEVLPDIATRAFGWLTVAFAIIVCLSLFGVVGVVRLFRLTRTAWNLTKNANQMIDRGKYRRDRDEISTLGRIVTTLVARSRSRNALVRRQTAERNQELRIAQELLKLRHDRLDAIGHEIRSPLASLLNQTEGQLQIQEKLRKMQSAVETLLRAESVEDGIQSLEIVPVRSDVARFLAKYVANKNASVPCLTYVGPPEGLFVIADLLQLESVIEHLLDNALTHRAGGNIVISLNGDGPTIAVINSGKNIEPDRLDSIFKYKKSDGLLARNRGIGLYASRSYLIGMRATIHAENIKDGVAMIITLTAAS